MPNAAPTCDIVGTSSAVRTASEQGSRAGDGSSWRAVVVVALLPTLLGATVCGGAAPDTLPEVVRPDPNAPSVQFVIDQGSTFPISRFIYGVNCGPTEEGEELTNCFPRGATINRLGGNRWSAYDWTTNYSNAGSDWGYSNDDLLSQSRAPGEAVRARAVLAFAREAGLIVTVPMLGHVAGDGSGGMDVWDSTRAKRLETRFKVSKPIKGAPFTLTPDGAVRTVYQDEFVNWVATTFPGSRTDSLRPIFFGLDNEPDAWGETHEEIRSRVADKDSRLLTYDEFLATTIAFARAVKSVVPDAKVFGPGLATWAGYATLGRWPSPDPAYGSKFFLELYLDRLRDAARTDGKRLVDVLDLHWYPESKTSDGRITNDGAPQSRAMIEARIQAPRSLWDKSFDEKTWVSENAHGPIRLIPRLRDMIAAHYPGTQIAFTEYYFGRLGDITGGIAQADVLGIFGREGVFAANLWPQVDVSAAPYGGRYTDAMAYGVAAFAMYRNYDGRGGRFGDVGLSASSSDYARSSVYGSRDALGRTVLVVINKTAAPLPARIELRRGQQPKSLRAYTLTSASPQPLRQTDQTVGDGIVTYTMPAMSVSTLLFQ